MSRNAKIGLSILGAVVLAAVSFGCGRMSANPPVPPTTTERTFTTPVVPPPFTTEDEYGTSEYPYGTSDYPDNGQTTEHTVPAQGAPAGFPSSEILRGAPDTAAQTFTGLRALPQRPIAIENPNHRNFPHIKIEHAFGVAQNGKPHQISIDSQGFFESKGYAAITYDTSAMQPGGEKSLYLTFDCGYENGNTAIILDVLQEKNVKAAFFLTSDYLKSAPELVVRMIDEGHIVGNHSETHPSFPDIDRAAMAREVLNADNYLRTHFGYSAPFFRFPRGDYSESALDAVASLGFTSVFWSSSYADWDVNNQKGAQYALDTVVSRLHPGAILLLHSVSSDNAAAMADIIDHAREQGFVFRELTGLPFFHS